MEIAFSYVYRTVDSRIANNPLDQIRVQNSAHHTGKALCASRVVIKCIRELIRG